MKFMNSSVKPVFSLNGFPPRRERVRAKWAPVYLEPMTGSGERITVAVVAAHGREHFVYPLPHLNRLDALYGNESAPLKFAVGVALDQLHHRFNLNGEGAFAVLSYGVDGVFLGEPTESAGDTLREIAEQGIRLRSSIFEVHRHADMLVLREEPRTVVSAAPDSIEAAVRALVARNIPALADAFERRFSAVQGTRFTTTISFVGKRVAANFLELARAGGRTTKLESKVSDGRSKLWSLMRLRDSWANDEFQETREYSLMVQTGGATCNERVKDAVAELAAEAQGEEILFGSYQDVEGIAREILQSEHSQVA